MLDKQKPYSIEAGIAIAPRKHARDKYPFALMKVGESFAVADDTAMELNRVKGAQAFFQKNHPPMKFSVLFDPDIGRHRVWRTK